MRDYFDYFYDLLSVCRAASGDFDACVKGRVPRIS